MIKFNIVRLAAVILFLSTGAAIAGPTTQKTPGSGSSGTGSSRAGSSGTGNSGSSSSGAGVGGVGSSVNAKGAERSQQAAQRSRAIGEITAAVKTLQGEFEAHLKDNSTALRQKPDYFTPESSADLTPDLVLEAVSKNYGASNSESCYVKWQLMSYFDPKADSTKLSTQSIGMLYLRAPSPDPHPSLLPSIRALLDREVPRLSASTMQGFNDQWAAKIASWGENNKPTLAYDDLLAGYLPDSLAKYKLMWTDLFEKRVPAGVAVGDRFKIIEPQITTWAASASPADRKSFAAIVKQTAEMLKDRTPIVYGSVTMDDTTKRPAIAKTPVDAPNYQVLTDLATAVSTGSAVPSTK